MSSLRWFARRRRATKRPATRASHLPCRLQFEMLEDRSMLAGFVEIDKLTASDAAAGDWFGNSVAISGDTVVVGANHDDNAARSSMMTTTMPSMPAQHTSMYAESARAFTNVF